MSNSNEFYFFFFFWKLALFNIYSKYPQTSYIFFTIALRPFIPQPFLAAVKSQVQNSALLNIVLRHTSNLSFSASYSLPFRSGSVIQLLFQKTCIHPLCRTSKPEVLCTQSDSIQHPICDPLSSITHLQGFFLFRPKFLCD